MAIKGHGGAAVAQDPDEALYDGMPRSAIAHVDLDAVLPLREMAGWLARHRPTEPPSPGGMQEMQDPQVPHVADPPRPDASGTRFTCPDCGGTLFEQQEDALTRFRCSVGHVFSIQSLSSAQATQLESALWTAVRALEDRAELLRKLAARSRNRGIKRTEQSLRDQAADLEARAGVIREAIESGRRTIPDDEAEAAF
jgi:two-component system, chemotaxis family, protein-glutamate methylesterase/glutaminase